MSQCSFCLKWHNGKQNHTCSKGLATKDGFPKVGDGKCPEGKDTYEKQGEKYCPSECFRCKEMDVKVLTQDCKQNEEAYKTIDGKKFYTERPKTWPCSKYIHKTLCRICKEFDAGSINPEKCKKGVQPYKEDEHGVKHYYEYPLGATCKDYDPELAVIT